jgi:hypothetical protein
VKLRGHLAAFHRSQLLKTAASNGNLGEGLAKEEFCTDMFGLLSPNNTLNL